MRQGPGQGADLPAGRESDRYPVTFSSLLLKKDSTGNRLGQRLSSGGHRTDDDPVTTVAKDDGGDIEWMILDGHYEKGSSRMLPVVVGFVWNMSLDTYNKSPLRKNVGSKGNIFKESGRSMFYFTGLDSVFIVTYVCLLPLSTCNGYRRRHLLRMKSPVGLTETVNYSLTLIWKQYHGVVLRKPTCSERKHSVRGLSSEYGKSLSCAAIALPRSRFSGSLELNLNKPISKVYFWKLADNSGGSTPASNCSSKKSTLPDDWVDLVMLKFPCGHFF